ncbi:hypothetical protein JZU46_06370, partial [bacterium]|nr:hypothetical protein [bacterium]
MKIRIKLATFREYKYHVEGHPPTGIKGVYGEIECSNCGRIFRDKGCDDLDITNPGGWYAAQIDCVCKKGFIEYEDHDVYVADVVNAIIKDIPKKEVKPVRVKSKYADVNTNQYLQSGPR